MANPSADVYGSDLQLLESVSALTAAGYRVVVAIPADGPLVPRLRERGAEVEFVAFPVLRRANQSASAFAKMLADIAMAIPRLVRYVRDLQPDLVYVNTVTLPWWLLAARLSRRPVLCHLHEAETTDGSLVRRLLIAPLRLADAVIVISQSVLTAMVDAVPALKPKGQLIYNGVPQPPTPPTSAQRSHPSNPAPIRLAVVGRLSPRKAPHLALEVAARLRNQGYDVRLELAGSAFTGYEWYVDQLRQRANQPDLIGPDATSAVTFAGYCSPIWPTLEQTDIVLAPSLREPFGNAVVEAQLALRPVVATDALGHRESITDGETGLLVPAEDVAAMAAAVARLIDDPEFSASLAASARANAISRFSTQRYDAEVVDLVDLFAKSRRGGRGSTRKRNRIVAAG